MRGKNRILYTLGFTTLSIMGAMLLCAIETASARTNELRRAGRTVPILETDKSGYLGGETVQVRGSGFSPSESVLLQVFHADGGAEAGMGHESWTVTANAQGAFTSKWSINPNDISGRDFVVMAVGSSRSQAKIPFKRVAVLHTDRSGYQPGEIIRITGDGFLPNEVVVIESSLSTTSTGRQSEPIFTVSDAKGRINATSGIRSAGRGDELLRLSATGASSGIQGANLITIPADFFVVKDQQGANDQPGQKDLTMLGRDELDPAYLKIFWNWDDVSFSGQVGDACALFDSDGDGNINYVICAEVQNGSCSGPSCPAVVQTAISPLAFTCGDGKPDRCTTPTQVCGAGTSMPCTHVTCGVLGNPSNSSGNLVTDTDPFSAGGASPLDTTLECIIEKSFLPSNAVFVNVCSYESIGSGANTSPGDCITNPGGGYLVIKKDAGDDTLTSFSFTIDSTSDSLDPVTSTIIGTGESDPLGLFITDPGTGEPVYSAIENVPSGWDLKSASCVLSDGTTTTGSAVANGVGNIKIESGKVTTCTFTDAKRGNIIVKKLTNPAGSQQNFTFTPSYGSSFNLAGGQAKDSGPLADGTYSVVESALSGWDLTGAVCDNGDSPAAIHLTAGHTITCTFTNTQRATLIVKKVMVGGTDTFTFTGTPSGSISANNGTVWASVAPGQYSSVEGAVLDWDLNSISCDDANSSGNTGTRTATFNAEAGETVTCTFTNTKRATVIVKKVMVGGSDIFAFTGTPSGSISTNNGTISASVAPGQYTSAEAAKGEWDLNGISCDDANSSGNVGTRTATFHAEAGETVTCTFTNTKRATLIVKKVMIGGTGTFSFSGNPSGTISTNNGTISASVAPGQYSSVEGAVLGWDLNTIACDDANSSGNVGTRTATFNAEAGETVTCTFTNTKQATVTVKKVMVGGTGSFAFTGTPAGTISTNNGTISASVAPGQYLSVEGDAEGWDLNSITCDDTNSTGDVGTKTATFNVEPGEAVTCTFTNIKRATLVVKKVMVGGTDTFTFTGTPSGSISANNGTISVPVVPGQYDSVEGAVTGWDLSSIICDDANSTGNVDSKTATFHAEAGETVTCTFTNTKRATLIVKKVMVGGTNTFTFTGTPSGLISTNNGTISASVVPGQYHSVEGAAAGWDLNSISCDDANSTGNVGSKTATFNAEAGEIVTCTFTNTKQATLIVKKVMVGGTGTFTFTGTPAGSISANNGTISASVAPGQYTSAEGATAGWDLNTIVCDDTNSSGNVGTKTATFNAEAGETVTCTFTNTKRAAIVVKKAAVGGDGTFSFTSDFGVSSITTSSHSGTVTVNNLLPGTYHVTELDPPLHWIFDSVSCSVTAAGNGLSNYNIVDRQATITLGAGATVTCTYTNLRLPQLRVVKLLVPLEVTSPTGATVANPDKFDLYIDSLPVFNCGGGGCGNNQGSGYIDVSVGDHAIHEQPHSTPLSLSYTTSISCTDGSHSEQSMSLDGIHLSPGDTVTCTIANINAGNGVTDSSLCYVEGFKVLYIQDGSSSYRLNASNPGQFYDNVFTQVSGGPVNLSFTIPYPFVTQGAVPIQVHSMVALNDNGCYVPVGDITKNYQITITPAHDPASTSPSGAPIILRGDYGAQSMDSFMTVTVTGPSIPATGIIYITTHLDYGLKPFVGSPNATDWLQGGGNAAVGLSPTDIEGVRISNSQSYVFTFDNDPGTPGITSQDDISSSNVFKQSPGFAGVVTNTSGDPVAGATVTIIDSAGKFIGTAATDSFGGYFYPYKYSGKPTILIFALKFGAYADVHTAAIKSNGFVLVDFTDVP